MDGTESRKEKFQELLLTLSKELEEGDLIKLKLLLKAKDSLPQAKIQDANGAIPLFIILQNCDEIGHDKTKELKKWLTKADRCDLAKKVTDYELCETMQDLSLSVPDAVPVNVKMSMVVQNFKETVTSKELEEKIERDKVVILHGMLGSGKSQMALWFGCKFQQHNKNSVVWRFNGKNLNLLHSSVLDLGKRLKIQINNTEQTETESAIAQLAEEIMKQINRSGHHFFIIDDVNKKCEPSVRQIIQTLVRGTESKCIITTQNSILDCGCAKVQVQGFSDIEAIEFFTDGKTANDEKKPYYLDLSKFFNRSPLGLHGVKTYMESCNISPKKMLQLLKCHWNQVGEELSSHYAEQSLIRALSSCIEIMKSDEDERVFEMFQMLQFLDTENIPVYMFEFLPLSKNGTKNVLHTNSFIQAMKKFSFGTIEGEDDKRFLSTHQAVTKTLKENTSAGDQRKLLVNLLKCFAWLLDKDNLEENDLKRNKSLLTHAREAVDIAEKLFDKPSIHECFLLIYVCDLVGYIYNFCGLIRDAGIYSKKANDWCFRLIEKTEENVNTDAKQMVEQKDINRLEELSICIAEVISKELQLIMQNEKEQISEFALEYLKKKHRVHQDQVMLEKILPKRESDCVQISEKEYEELVARGHALAIDIIPELFLYEMIIQVCYTYGRRLFYAVQPNPELKDDFSKHLYTAKHLGLKMKEKYPDSPLLYSLLSQRNGTLELPLDNYTNFLSAGEKQEALRRNIKSFEELLTDDSKYFVFGIFKMRSSEDDYHRKQCRKHLVRCYKDMYGLKGNEEEKEDLKKNGCKHANALLEALDREKKPDHGCTCRVAQFFLTVGNLDKATALFERICPFHPADTTKCLSSGHIFSKHEMNACFGLIECCHQKGNLQYAQYLTNTLEKKLEKHPPGADNDAYKKKVAEIQNKLESEIQSSCKITQESSQCM